MLARPRIARPSLARPPKSGQLPTKVINETYATQESFSDLRGTRFPDQFPTEVVPSLYLGSVNHSAESVLRALNITHVVNVAAFGADRSTPPAGIEPENYLALSIPDVPTYDIVPHLEDTIKFIRAAIVGQRNERGERVGGTVLVHCQLGVSRSAAIVIAYLMVTEPSCRRFDDAHAFVKRKRPCVYPNLGFSVALTKWPETLTQEQSRAMCEPKSVIDSPDGAPFLADDIDMDILTGGSAGFTPPVSDFHK